MLRRIGYVLSAILLSLALAPWLLSGCQPGALLPDDLRQERLAYEATVAAARAATAEAMRNAKSTVQVYSVQTLEPAVTNSPGTDSDAVPTSRVIVSTVTPPGDAPVTPLLSDTPMTAALSTMTLTPLSSAGTPTGLGPATPLGMREVEDILTEQIIAEQLKQDAADSDLTDIQVFISPEGVQFAAKLTLLPGISQEIQATGTFSVEMNSLTVQIASITLEQRDVTQQYARRLESRLDSSLYRLLPQRFVQRYALAEGEVLVWSMMK